MQLLTAGKGTVRALAFAPNGAALVASCSSPMPVLWDLPATGIPVPLAENATNCLGSFTFSTDAAVVGWLTTGQQRMEHDRRTGTTRTIAVIPARESVYAQVVCGPDARLVVRTWESGVGLYFRAFVPDGDTGWVEAWHIGPTDTSGWYLAGSPLSERFFTWNTPSHEPPIWIVVRSSLTGNVLAETVSPLTSKAELCAKPDGSAVIAYKQSSLYYWQPGEKVQKIRTGTLTHYRCLAFHPDGRHLLAGNNDTTARLIDTTTWQVVRQYTWAIGRLTAVAISPDGQLAAAGDVQGRVVVWDLDL